MRWRRRRRHGYVGEGDILVITGGSVEAGVGTTDLMKVHLIERVLAHGTGLGDRKVIGRVRRLAAPLVSEVRVEPDEIVVTPYTDRTFLPVLRRAAGLVTEAAAADAHCRLLALEMGLPAVVGVREGIGGLPDGMHIVMDAKRGLVYERPPVLLRPTEGIRDWGPGIVITAPSWRSCAATATARSRGYTPFAAAQAARTRIGQRRPAGAATAGSGPRLCPSNQLWAIRH